MSLPVISVIIPTCNRLETLTLCLDKLVNGQQQDMELIPAGKTNGSELTPSTYEVIVSDDSKDTATQAWVETHYPWVRYCRGPQKGPAANRNNGAKQAHGLWLIFTDDDCLPQKNWVLNYHQGIETHPEAQALEGCILPTASTQGDSVICPSNENGGNFWSANIAVKHDLFRILNGFDEYFPYAKMEDIDFHIRVKEKTTIPFLKNCIVWHPVEKLSLIQSIQREFKGTDSHGYILAKHPKEMESTTFLRMLYSKYKNYFKGMLKALIKGHIKRTLTVIIAMIGEIPIVSYYYLHHKKHTFKP